jgi:hypothetical protein
MNIYLAARYSRRDELCEYRRQLQQDGHTVTSRWLNGSHQITNEGKPIDETGEALIENGTCEEAARLRRAFVLEDVADILAAECVVSFTEAPRSNHSRGGRHVEFGMAHALGKQLIVVGHQENLFHYLPQVAFYADWQRARESLEMRIDY